jgi:hypothetical protein
MADHDEAAKKSAEQAAAAKEKTVADAEERQQGQPTPTQEENDLAASGANVAEKEDDGSGPDRLVGESKEDAERRHKDMKEKMAGRKESKPAQSPGGYQTRATQPRPTSGSTENK